MAQLISIRDFSERYSISRATVYRLKNKGEISFLKIGRATRIKTEDAERWFASLNHIED